MGKRRLKTIMALAMDNAGYQAAKVERCPIHHQRTKPCKACEDAYRAAKEQQITQNRADAQQAHAEWLKQRAEGKTAYQDAPGCSGAKSARV